MENQRTRIRKMVGERHKKRKRNAEISKPRIIKSESDKNTNQRNKKSSRESKTEERESGS